MKIAVIGADGQLGSDLVSCLGERWTGFFPLFYPDFDLMQPLRARLRLKELDCDVVINTAAFNRVDDCEDHPEDAFRLNAFAVRRWKSPEIQAKPSQPAGSGWSRRPRNSTVS